MPTATDRTLASLTVDEVQRGDRVLFDALYGLEKVLHANAYKLSNGVYCWHLNVAANRDASRFIVRASHEQVLVLR